MEGDGKTERVSPAEGKKRLEKFIKAFEGSEEAVRELVDALVGEEDSLAAYLDETIKSNHDLAKEVRGLRKDLRSLARAQGYGGIFEAFGG